MTMIVFEPQHTIANKLRRDGLKQLESHLKNFANRKGKIIEVLAGYFGDKIFPDTETIGDIKFIDALVRQKLRNTFKDLAADPNLSNYAQVIGGIIRPMPKDVLLKDAPIVLR